jgi:hypothetical protein
MRRLVIICPVCGDSINMPIEDAGHLLQGGFNSRCGTQITFSVDMRFETETERIAALKEKARETDAKTATT